MVIRLTRLTRRITAYISDPVNRLQLSASFLLLFLLVGIFGYMLIEDMSAVDALYMTVITVTTVGFGDIVPTNQASRIFTVILIFLGIGAATTAVSNAIEVLIGQHLWGAVRERRIEEVLKVMEDHYIIAGYGRIGRQIVRDILARGELCTVLDMDESIQADEFLMDENVPFLIGDATDENLLKRAGIERAKGFVSALRSDADNVLAILTARGVKEDLFIVARASETTSESKLRRAGADRVVSPYQVGGHRLAMALMRPAVNDFMEHLSDVSDTESFDIGQIDVLPGSRLVGQSILKCDLRRVRGLTILAIKGSDGRLDINPHIERVFEPGDHLIVIGPPQHIYSLEEIHGAIEE